MNIPTRTSLITAVALLLAYATPSAAAQSAAAPATTRLIVQVTNLKPDKVDVWRKLQQNEVNPALKKAGVTSRTVSETVMGERFQYVSIRTLASFAELDGGGMLGQALGERGAAVLNAKLEACIQSSQRYVINSWNEFRIQEGGALVRTTTTYRVNPGAGPLLRDLVRTRLLPAYQQAKADGKIAGYAVSTTGPGNDVGVWIFSTYLPNLAALDAGSIPVQLLGEVGAQAVAAQIAHLATPLRTVVRRQVPELSF
jgi:hypothetical protein